MKFDMHCHTKEGSMDGKVPIEDYIIRLKELGFKGMLVSDHNTYNGYREWKNHIKGERHKDFIVLKGIEYDTIDAGHILVIMPEGVKIRVLELRGLPIKILIDVVHKNGGILGPAHPCGERYLGIANTKKKRNKDAIFRKFDFIETFNACESDQSNESARMLAERFMKPGFGGSDSHRYDCIGTAYTELPKEIRRESDLIRYIQSGGEVTCGGTPYTKTTKDKMGKWHQILVQSFYLYNKTASLYRKHRRKEELKKLHV
ncbi:MAG: PHP-associated domain-containing protein [Ruminococcus sp.]|jgi:predicted metal-dependent phosphoesterase TrpH